METFRETLSTALSARETFVAFVHCEIAYSGRAETFLPRGDRLLVVKQDGTLLVHRPDGSTPVNYMKAGTEIAVEMGEGHLILRAFNPKEKAWLNVEIFRVHDAMRHRLEDGQVLDLAGNEADMSDWIRDNPACISAGFRPASREEQTDVGFIDVFGKDERGLVVVECKRITASLSAADQLRRYVERVKQIRGTDAVRGYLAAPAITPNALEILASWGFRFRRVQPPRRLERWSRHQRNLAEF